LYEWPTNWTGATALDERLFSPVMTQAGWHLNGGGGWVHVPRRLLAERSLGKLAQDRLG
jgi:hypothetical protein